MKEEEKVIEQTVENPTVVNEDVIKTENENAVVDDNTTEDSDVDDSLEPAIEPVVSTEDQTLAPTDDVIPAPVDTPVDTPVNEPVADAPLADIVPPSFDVPVDAPVDTPAVDETPLTGDPTLDAPVEAPVEAPGTEVVDPIIPEDPAPVVSDVVPEVGDENPGDVAVPGDACDNCNCGDPACPCENPTITIGQYFGTLQESVTIVWRYHLKTRKYSVHIALNEFYEKALEIVDDIIEQYQGICGVVEEPFVNCVIGEGKTEGEYITELKAFVENNRCVASCGHSEIDSVIDEFLGLIDSTNYKLVNLTENAVKSFEEFVYEDYQVDEGCHCDEEDSQEEEEE